MVRSYPVQIQTQADQIRTAIRYIKDAREITPTTLTIMAAEPAMEMIYEDFDNLIRKYTNALDVYEAYLELEEVE